MFLKGGSPTLISGCFDSRRLFQKNIYSENLCHEDLQMTKVIQNFQETGLVNSSPTRPMNLNKLITNTFNKI